MRESRFWSGFGLQSATKPLCHGLFLIDATLGVDLSPYSSYPEAEVLLMPGAKLEVEQIMAPQMLGGVLHHNSFFFKKKMNDYT